MFRGAAGAWERTGQRKEEAGQRVSAVLYTGGDIIRRRDTEPCLLHDAERGKESHEILPRVKESGRLNSSTPLDLCAIVKETVITEGRKGDWLTPRLGWEAVGTGEGRRYGEGLLQEE